METAAAYRDYGFPTAAPSHMVQRFIGPVMRFAEPLAPGTRVLDVGCGNGAVCGEFIRRGCEVVGVDLSEQGIAIARATYPQGRFELIAADATILERLNETPFDIVVSTEVVEHLYAPREWARGCFAALRPGGKFICTTPYHGYLKNLLISITGTWDNMRIHFGMAGTSSSGASIRLVFCSPSRVFATSGSKVPAAFRPYG